MTALNAIRETVELLDHADGGQRLRCVAEPAAGPVCGQVLLAPPFAEELNKSRRMCAQLARRLAQHRWRVVRVDLHGCGDSSGELRDATWEGWLGELRVEARQLRDRWPGPLWFWCVRAGALFAPGLIEAVPGASLLLWQPVLSGAICLQQFLRLSVAAGLFGDAKADAQARPAAQRLAEGETVEVAGYEISPALADGLRAAAMKLQVPHGGRVIWLEVTSTAADGCSPAAIRAADVLRAAGWATQLQAVSGAPFWQTTEIVENEELLERSVALLGAGQGAAPEAAVYAG